MLFDQESDQNINSMLKELQTKEDQVIQTSPCTRFQKFNERIKQSGHKIVHRGYDRQSGRQVCWNTIQLYGLTTYERKLLFRRIKSFKQLKHTNFVRCIHSWVNRQSMQLIYVSELVNGGTLKSHLAKIKPPKVKIIKGWCQQILQALQHYHTNNNPMMAYTYLRCDQILINTNSNQLKLSEEGFICDAIEQCRSAYYGCPQWIPPEVSSWNVGQHTDVYCFGMILIEILTLRLPYSQCNNPAEIYKLISKGILPAQIEEIVDPELKNLVIQCLADQNVRPTVTGLLAMPLWKQTKQSDHLQVELDSRLAKQLENSFVTVLSSGSSRQSMANLEKTITTGNKQSVTLTFQAPHLGLKCFRLKSDNLPNFSELFQDVVVFVEEQLQRKLKESNISEGKIDNMYDMLGEVINKAQSNFETAIKEGLSKYETQIGKVIEEKSRLQQHLLQRIKAMGNSKEDGGSSLNNSPKRQYSVTLSSPQIVLEIKNSTLQAKRSALIDTQRNEGGLINRLFRSSNNKFFSFSQIAEDSLKWTTSQSKQRKMSALDEPMSSGNEFLRIGQISPIKEHKMQQARTSETNPQIKEERKILNVTWGSRKPNSLRVPNISNNSQPTKQLLLFDVKHY